MTHICVGNLTTIGSDNGLSAPSHYLNQCWNIVNCTPRNKLQWNVNWISYKKIHLKMSSGKWRPFCLGLNVLTKQLIIDIHAPHHCMTHERNKCSPISMHRITTWPEARYFSYRKSESPSEIQLKLKFGYISFPKDPFLVYRIVHGSTRQSHCRALCKISEGCVD